MSEISREEFNQRMDKMFICMDTNHKEVTETVTQIRVAVAVVETKVDNIEIPEIPDRPCDDLKEHITEHKESIDSYRKPIIVGCVTLAIILITKFLPIVVKHLLSG